MSEDEELERRLRAEALRPSDPAFTQRVMRALPPRSRGWVNAILARSFVMTTRVAIVLLLIAAAQRCYIAGSGAPANFLVFLLFVGPVFAALSHLCGPPIPRSFWQSVRRAGRNWR